MSDLLSKEEVEKINKLIKDVVQKTESITKNDKIRVILMGTTGAGKSSLTNALSSNGKLTIISGKGGKPILDGKGVVSGNISGTRDPGIDSSDECMVFCDCPGFEDTEGFLQEIVNAFAIDCLFSDNNKFKILLVATNGETENRAKSICNSIKRLEKIFINKNQLKNGIGLVITQGDNETTEENYAEIINDNPSEELKDMAMFFSNNKDRIFVFPRPPRSDVGKEYNFQDHDRLISFLKKDPIVNPEHQIALSETAELTIKNLKKIYDKKASDEIKNVTDKINMQFRKEEKLEEIKKWIERMEKIKNSQVKKANEFPKIIKINIPDYDKYNDDMKSLTEFEVFDRFIDKVLKSDSEESSIVKQIQDWAQQSIRELKEKRIKNQVKSITEKISSHFIDLKKQEEFDKLIKDMNTIKSKIIKNQNDFASNIIEFFSKFKSDVDNMDKYDKEIDISSQFNDWVTQSIKDLEKMKENAKEQERKQREAEEKHRKEMAQLREKEKREQRRREQEAEERHKKELKEQERKQREAEERLRKEIEKSQKPKVEMEYRRKVTKERIWTTHYRKWFMWAKWTSGTDYYIETKTECEKRKRIIQNNEISYSKWTDDSEHSGSTKSGNCYSDDELWNCTLSTLYYKGLDSTNAISKEEYYNL